MATPEKTHHPQSQLSPARPSLPHTPPRSPFFPDTISDYTQPLPFRYASGVLPVTFTIDESTKVLKWKVLLLIEFRAREKRLCLHPLAGKKEEWDDHYPIRTASREFTEETYGVYADFDVLGQISTNVRDHSLLYMVPESKMILFYVYVPYKENIQELYLKAKGDSQQGEALIWYDLDEFLTKKGSISYEFNGQNVIGSVSSQLWFLKSGLLEGFNRIRTVTLERLEKTNSPLAPVHTDTTTSSVNELTEAITGIVISTSSTTHNPEQVATPSKPSTHPDTSSSSPTKPNSSQ